MQKRKSKFKHCEAIVFNPKWWNEYPEYHEGHPIKYGEVVYFLGEIPNVPSHCIITKWSGTVVVMVHTEDFRKAKESEL